MAVWFIDRDYNTKEEQFKQVSDIGLGWYSTGDQPSQVVAVHRQITRNK